MSFHVPQSFEVPTVQTLGLPQSAFSFNSTPLGVFMDTRMSPPVNLTTAFLWSENSDADTVCLVAAKWADGDVWISEPNQRTPESSYSVDPFVSASAFTDPAELITIAADWAHRLHTIVSPRAAVPNSVQEGVGVFERIRATCDGDIQCLSVTVALYLTDALSRQHGTHGRYTTAKEIRFENRSSR
ncbi:hypothetical protein MMYC01_206056 [Madurella mycetomatis]|uniref:Uncharacterized protein n=1 Tax=Madurella mycetomatis TaxID=100816 RepID=A0A175W1K1_9PEZI|nr:hypothetical protein MMYC01_206056 [Madurella mycetomatis]